MAEAKKTAVVKPVAKAVVAKETEVKEEVKVEAPVVKEEVKDAEVKKAEPKKETAKKPAAKKATTKKATEKKAPAKKEAVEKKEAPAAKKATKEIVHVQFAGKSYTTEDLVQSAKDVWKYDLNQKPADFKTVELYVKPEENLAYYVINGDVTGSFFI